MATPKSAIECPTCQRRFSGVSTKIPAHDDPKGKPCPYRGSGTIVRI